MMNAKALLLVSLLSVSGAVVADECCKSVCGTEEVACNPEVCAANACPVECKKDNKAAKADVLEIAQNDAAPEAEAEVKG